MSHQIRRSFTKTVVLLIPFLVQGRAVAQGDAPQFLLLFELNGQGGSFLNFSQPKVADLDRDGVNEIVAAAFSADQTGSCHLVAPQGIYAWDAGGNLKAGFPVLPAALASPPLCGYLSIVALGDVTGDSHLEIVAATGRGPYGGGVFVLSATGTVLTHIQPTLGFSGVNFQSPVLYDFDGDGKLDIAMNEYGVNQLYVWKGNGTPISGWPVTLSTQAISGCEPAVSPICVGDICSPGIVIANVWPLTLPASPSVKAYDLGGNLLWSTPTPHPYRPVLGDVDGSGVIDVVVKTLDSSTGAYEMLILDVLTGAIKYRWPTGEGFSVSRLVTLADFNFDGIQEILYHDGKALAMTNHLGTPHFGWPRALPAGYDSLTDLGVADLSGDGFLDVYGIAVHVNRTGLAGNHQNALFAWDPLGQPLGGFPYKFTNLQNLFISSYSVTFQPTVVDVDNDGKVNVLARIGWGRIQNVRIFANSSSAPCFPQYGANVNNTKACR